MVELRLLFVQTEVLQQVLQMLGVLGRVTFLLYVYQTSAISQIQLWLSF